MKKLLFLLLVFTAISMQAVAACGFESVSVDDCCVTFEVIENGYDYTVDMEDGTVLTESGEYCYSDNGNYPLVLTYFKDGVPRCGATYNIQVTDCGGISCDDCGLDPGEIITQSTNDPCTFRLTNNASGVVAPCEIADRNWTAENGTITELAGGLFAEIVFDSHGTHEVCIDIVASTGTETCVEQVCTFVTVSEDCGGVSCEDCGLNPGEIITESTNDPCTFRFTNWGPEVVSPCEILEGNWTAENGTVTEFADGLFAQVTFNGPGIYEVCVDVVASTGTETCVEQVCTFVTVSEDCGGDTGCDDICKLNPGSIKEYFAPDPCTRLVSSYGSVVHFPCEIVDWNWTAENGTVTELAGGIFAQITFNGSGTHEVCVDVVASDGTQTCVETVCIDVFISEECIGCDVIDDKECNEGARVYQDTEFIQANVYPNPANQYITFEIFTFEETEAQISLINSQGQVIRSYTQQFAADTTQFTINDLSALSEGVYFYHIQMGDHTKTGKISIFK